MNSTPTTQETTTLLSHLSDTVATRRALTRAVECAQSAAMLFLLSCLWGVVLYLALLDL